MVILVKDYLLVIRMSVCYLTQWDASWGMERVCKWGEIRKNCGNRWKNQKLHYRSPHSTVLLLPGGVVPLFGRGPRRKERGPGLGYLRCAPSSVTAMRQFAEERLCQAWRVPF
jgi:hypothetical protein